MNGDTNSNTNRSEEVTDENERLALEECVKRHRLDHRVSVLLMPSGWSNLASRFVQLGAEVTLADAPARSQEVQGRLLAGGLKDSAHFVPYTLPELPYREDSEPYDIIVLQDGLCALPYETAKTVIRGLMQKLRIGGKLYLSILGLHSELGEGYAGVDLTLNERFSPLTAKMAKKYDIQGPVCLYTERNLFMLLLESGASVLRTLTTTYGNVKGVAVRV